MMKMPTTLIEVSNLSIIYPSLKNEVLAIDNISFKIFQGEILALFGKSGSGKSSIAKALLRLIPKSSISGQINLVGNDAILDLNTLSSSELMPIRGKDISMIFQDPLSSFSPVRKCGDQIIEAIIIHQKIPKSTAREKALDLFEKCGLDEGLKSFESYPHQLSGGQLQRAAIAMAIANSPKLLIADESLTSLDGIKRNEVLSLLYSLSQKLGISILFITHDLELIQKFSNRIIKLDNGRIISTSTTDSYFDSLKLNPPDGNATSEGPVINKNNQSSQIILDAIGLVYNSQKNFISRKKTSFRALQNISFSLAQNEIIGVIGESGSGKSSIAKLLTKLIDPSEGRLTFNSQDYRLLQNDDLKEFRKKVQIIFQNPLASFDRRLRLRQSLIEPLIVNFHELNHTEILAKIVKCINDVGLDEGYLERFPSEVSGGELQRLCIARALSFSPKFLICDEGLSSLDYDIKNEILTLLKKLNTDFGLSILFISHDLEMVRGFCDKIIILKNGHIIEMGSIMEILNSPMEEYTQKLIEASSNFSLNIKK